MKYVSVITDYTYLLWQQEIQVFNFKKLGILDDLVVVILIDPWQKSPSDYVKQISSLCETHIYINDQKNRSYIPSNKPYGIAKLLEEYPSYGDEIFILDSDVIFTDILDFSKMNEPGCWYVSDTRSYLGYCYLKAKLTDPEISKAASIIGVTLDTIKEKDFDSGGAQYYLKGLTADFCYKVARDSTNLYAHLNRERKVQVWTAEMWSWLWNAFLVADVRVSREMQFGWPTSPLQSWGHGMKILHMAGVVEAHDKDGIFRKGKYPHSKPWDDPAWSAHLKPGRCDTIYVELIKEYISKEE